MTGGASVLFDGNVSLRTAADRRPSRVDSSFFFVAGTADHVAKYAPFLNGANRLTDKGAVNRGGMELLGELLGNPGASRSISSASAHYGGSVLEIMDSATGRGARWSVRGGGIQFEGWL